LFKYCQFRCASVADAEDLAAEAFVRLLAQPPMPAEKVLPWLFKVAANLNSDLRRVWSREVPLARLENIADPPTQWRDPTMWQAVRRLVPRQQLAIYLRVVEDWSYADIGNALGTSEAAAKMIYHRALHRLAALLGPR